MDSESGTISSSNSERRGNILCAIISHAKSTRRNTLRKTWVSLVPPGVDVKFFVGHQEGELEDGVINLHCCDNHEGIPDKVREICRWALRHGYEFMWKVDDDVQLKPSKLLEITDPFYAVILHTCIYPFISGFLYGFNRPCMEVLSASDIPHYENGWDCGYYQDECWVTENLGRIGIPCTLITDCGVIFHEFEKAFPPLWVVAVHGENVPTRSLEIFKQINGIEKLTTRRLRKRTQK